jgi:hypothetical protein
VLENAGLVLRRRDAQRRPCRLAARPLAEVTEWLERYRQFREASFDRPSTEARDAVLKTPMAGGVTQSYDRVAAILDEDQADGDKAA